MKKNKTLLISVFALAAGVIMLAAGVLRGEARAVMEKAVVICLECIGIG